ncbi:unnamed protein product, partial [Coregonus sp. 'balchen']
ERSAGVGMSDSLPLPSYKGYPADRPSINTTRPSYTHLAKHTHIRCQTLPSKSFSESSSAAILSALMNLQDKIRKLELERGRRKIRELELKLLEEEHQRKLVQDQPNEAHTQTHTHTHTQDHANQRERRGVEREQETLFRRMERKGEQISKLHRYTQVHNRLRRLVHLCPIHSVSLRVPRILAILVSIGQQQHLVFESSGAQPFRQAFDFIYLPGGRWRRTSVVMSCPSSSSNTLPQVSRILSTRTEESLDQLSECSDTVGRRYHLLHSHWSVWSLAPPPIIQATVEAVGVIAVAVIPQCTLGLQQLILFVQEVEAIVARQPTDGRMMSSAGTAAENGGI